MGQPSCSTHLYLHKSLTQISIKTNKQLTTCNCLQVSLIIFHPGLTIGSLPPITRDWFCCGPIKRLCNNISKTMLEWDLSEKLQLTITNFLFLNPTNYLDLELVNPPTAKPPLTTAATECHQFHNCLHINTFPDNHYRSKQRKRVNYFSFKPQNKCNK